MGIFILMFLMPEGWVPSGDLSPSQKSFNFTQERIQGQATEWSEKVDFIEQRGQARKANPHKVYPLIQNLSEKWGNGTLKLHFCLGCSLVNWDWWWGYKMRMSMLTIYIQHFTEASRECNKREKVYDIQTGFGKIQLSLLLTWFHMYKTWRGKKYY